MVDRAHEPSKGREVGVFCRSIVLAALGLMLSVVAGCAREPLIPDREPPSIPIDDLAQLDNRHEDIPHVDSASWVDVYFPQLAFNGYTLDLYKRRVPVLLDMNGRIVHSWPAVRAIGRVRLDDRGRLYVIGIDNRIKEYDWDGTLTWWYDFPDDEHLPHHDVVQLPKRHYLVLGRSNTARADYLIEVDRRGEVVWSWWAPDHLEEAFPGWDREAWDATHVNSINVLPENRWYDEGDERFRPGNILMSARNLNALLIIDRETGRIVWTHTDGLDYQHEAIMIPPVWLGQGNILFFNNRYHAGDGVRSSTVELIDPRTGENVWSYEGRYFFSSTAGASQPLPNGNVLISSSQGGRVFEVRPDGQVVWQLVAPSLPMRAERYPIDHCPQFGQLPHFVPERVDPRSKRQFVSIELSKLAIPEQYDVRSVYGSRREVLRETTRCNSLVFPPYSGMLVRYGLDDARLGPGELRVRFVATLQGPEDRRPVVVLDDTVDRHDESIWREQLVAAQHYPYMDVEMCVDAQVLVADPDEMDRAITWENPLVSSPYRPTKYDRLNSAELTAEEQKLQEEQLRAIGYIQ